jgi:hypothetical protein
MAPSISKGHFRVQKRRGPLENSRVLADYVKKAQIQKIIAQSFRIRGTLVVLCPWAFFGLFQALFGPFQAFLASFGSL